jgi:hypothetical protein
MASYWRNRKTKAVTKGTKPGEDWDRITAGDTPVEDASAATHVTGTADPDNPVKKAVKPRRNTRKRT